MMEIVQLNNTNKFKLGYQGEFGVTCGVFDCSEWVEEFGDGTLVGYHQRGNDKYPYPLNLVRQGNLNYWYINDIDTAQADTGQLEFQFYESGVLKKNKIITTITFEALDTGSTITPEPYEHWLQEMTSKIGELDTRIVTAGTYVSLTEGYKDDAYSYKEDALTYAQNASLSETNAKTSENNAKASENRTQTLADTLDKRIEEGIDKIGGAVESYVQEHKEELKGDKGEQGEQGLPGKDGKDGKDTIDDDITSTDTTWSSQKVADRLDEIELAKFPNVTIFGQPTIQQGQISNFSISNYAQFPFVVDFANQPFIIDCEITTGNEVSQQHNVFDSAFGLAFAVRNSRFVIALSTNGTTWNIGEGVGTHVITPNTTYRVRMEWNKANFILSYSTDGGTTYIVDITKPLTEQPYPKQIYIGVTSNVITDPSSVVIFNGSINLNYSSLTIANKVVWTGVDDVGLATRANVSLSNIDIEGVNKVKQIIDLNNKIIGLWSRKVIN